MEIFQLLFKKKNKKKSLLSFSLIIHLFVCVLFLFFFSGEHDEEELVCQETQVTQEMLEEQVVRLLTREVLELLSK